MIRVAKADWTVLVLKDPILDAVRTDWLTFDLNGPIPAVVANCRIMAAVDVAVKTPRAWGCWGRRGCWRR